MKNPPNFVMYVVMVKRTNSRKFDPLWTSFEDDDEQFAQGFRSKKDALDHCTFFQEIHGKKNAYVQQYGPYS